ncbi:hypothetical protein EV383_4335 [Pseudonocardia sediminis]|uniref:DUF4913 domain-containing protein n=1 Tax=Pseudonocardia sediminis TaxID=1397368 RepID=A0A4Q7UZ64_PSEST|nr:hypothetical protein [Pseudonocardia sediminis]RZT87412.1 hypothetical protein EV383_4335 [Pseudonocardia sediminis]
MSESPAEVEGPDLHAEVERLAGMVVALARKVGELESRDDPSAVRSWLYVDDEETAGFMLADLCAWVEKVWFQYDDARRLQPCWLYHPGIVEELWVLMNVHRGCFRKGGSYQQMETWHATWRPAAVERIRKYASSCEITEHQPGGDLDPARHPPVPGLSDVDAVAGRWPESDVPPSPPTPVSHPV